MTTALQGEMLGCRGYLVPSGTQDVTTIVEELDLAVTIEDELDITLEVEAI